VRLRGHAIECRIYAEDPSSFLPCPGPVHRVRWPQGAAVRIDAAVRDHSEVSSHYDPMIAKLTVWGPDRAAALARMRAALRDTVLLGIPTNIPLHLRILGEPDFVDGRGVNTRYLDTHPQLMQAQSIAPDDPRRLAVAAAAAVQAAMSAPASRGEAPPDAKPDEGRAWRESARWRG
jgi:acetyl/propionyl-CoA carboxylase alpha subunit